MFTRTLLNKSFFISLIIVAIGVFTAAWITVQANSKDDIVFPVAELNNCANKTECGDYCDEPANMLACVSFAEKHNLMSKKEAEIARKFSAIRAGPGKCASQKSCEAYCDDVNHIGECLAFAEEHGMMPEKELKEAKKVQAALARGAKLPGGCANKDQCEAFCENPNHMEECVAFAEAAGFMSSEEAKTIRKIGGKGPGDCKGREECEAFCEDPTHQDECFRFAQEHGLVPEEDMQRMEEGRQVMPGDLPDGTINGIIPDNMPHDEFFDDKKEMMMPPGQKPSDDGVMQELDMTELDAMESEIFEETPETELEEILDEIPADSLGGLLIKILSKSKK